MSPRKIDAIAKEPPGGSTSAIEADSENRLECHLASGQTASAATLHASEAGMNTTPLVSVIMAAYDTEAFIAETIASVQAQTLGDWELLVSDDASNDRTTAIVAAAAAKDPRIRLFRLARNGGVAQARNLALESAQGRFIAFLDSDDLWLPQKLERQIAFMEQQDAAVSYTAFRRMDETGRRMGRLISVPPRINYRELLKNTAIATLTSMIDTTKTGPIRMTEIRRDDYILWLSLLRRGFAAQGLQEDLARYRVVRGSLSSKPIRSATWVWDVYRKVEKLGLLEASWCMLHYSTRAVLKRLLF